MYLDPIKKSNYIIWIVINFLTSLFWYSDGRRWAEIKIYSFIRKGKNPVNKSQGPFKNYVTARGGGLKKNPEAGSKFFRNYHSDSFSNLSNINSRLNPTSYGISDSVAATAQISRKEDFWTLYCYRPFVYWDILRSHATNISKIERDIEISTFWDTQSFSFCWHMKIGVTRSIFKIQSSFFRISPYFMWL